MARFTLYLLIVVGLGYGAWSLFFSGSDEESGDSAGGGIPLSATAGAGAAPSVAASGGIGPGGTAVAPADAAAAAPQVKIEDLVAAADAALGEAAKATTRGAALERKDAARRLLSRAFLRCPEGAASEALRVRVDRLNEEVLFSEQPLPGKSVLHTFAATDRLWTLCHKVFPERHGVRLEPGFLLWVNGLRDARRIHEGEILKVPTEQVALLVSKTRFRLYVLLGGVYVKRFGVGIGAMDKTPEGVFEIDTKIKKPDWYSPQGRKIAFGSPENPLGTRWMGFKRTRRAAGYGIHGTIEPNTIGKAVSEGCVRMVNSDVEELFEWIARGTKVRITR